MIRWRPPGIRTLMSIVTRNDHEVIMAYPGLRMGNLLYFMLKAHLSRAENRCVSVLRQPATEEWISAFPTLQPLSISPAELRKGDRRLSIPALFFQEFGVDFNREQLGRFIHDALGVRPRQSGQPAPSPGRSITMNVRRGDYYSVPSFRAEYGFDLAGYFEEAFESIAGSEIALRVCVVSDDPEWCRRELPWLSQRAMEVEYVGPDRGPTACLLALAKARTLILSNSTFSYWGAYLSNYIHGDNYECVVVPKLHSRSVRAGAAWQHDPRWNTLAVRDE